MASLDDLKKARHVQGLVTILEHPDGDIRAMAAMYIGDIAGPDTIEEIKKHAVKPLIKMLLRDSSIIATANAARALARIKDKRAIFPLILCLGKTHHWHGVIREDASQALAEFRTPWAVIPLALGSVFYKDPRFKRPAKEALRKILGYREKNAPDYSHDRRR